MEALPLHTPWVERLLREVDAADRDADRLARGLTEAGLNWRPRAGSWSIGQCLHHLLLANEVYLPAIDAALEGARAHPVTEITPGWFTRWFMRAYIEANPRGRKVKPPRQIVPADRVDATILDRFIASNGALRGTVRRAAGIDVNRVRFRNPFVPVLRFTVGGGLEIVCRHERRHLLQMERVRAAPGFVGA